MRTFASMLLVLASACGDDAGSPRDAGPLDSTVVTFPAAPPIAPSTECRVETWVEPAASAMHVEACSTIDAPRHPRVGGPHYPVWADYGTYDQPIPSGYLIHSLEHGGIVLAYDCPSGCDDALTAFAAIIAEQGADPVCATHPAESRFIVVPDPELPDGSIAALAWENGYLATCLDEPSLRSFVDAHYGRAPENLCNPGLDASPDWCP